MTEIKEAATSGTEGYRLIHYSKEKRNSLNTNMHGSGIPDAADKRILNDGLGSSPIAKRIYFYVQPNNGIMPRPEVGLGGYIHEADPKNLNLYDYTTSTEEEKKQIKSKREEIFKDTGVSQGSAYELAINFFGYDGYVNHEQGMAVIMGFNKNVPVEYIGTVNDFEIEKRFK